ncbi:hypothetical protein [Desmospora profundinema]|uniref:Uncharacterized protein n=1 Tax=Desmospora profundinema TaxID=1571184 RepID=A0ABU1II43_9BACL|nr:hypothetical protein [Desmospora profundinema]MDR6224446.1 hypothetical protein [Desmospora profundinema]
MTKPIRFQWIPVIVGTLIAVNLMLIGLIVARNVTVFPESVPTWAQPGTPQLTTDYRMELESTTREGSWVVEHYRKIKIRLDENGKEVEQSPTSEQTHIRYWNGE